jgi:hypothetical protein
MSIFDFITDANFRSSLESDYDELTRAVDAHLWKTSYVLSGSIIEAVLIDYLLAIGYGKIDPLMMDLGTAIRAARAEGILSEKIEQLSAAVKSYRNLIHPGRKMRLAETVDEDGAEVARSLVNMIVKEVTKNRSEKYGYTAEQILSKLTRDSSVLSILDHLLNDMQEIEKERLLTHAIPDRYMNEIDSELLSTSSTLDCLEKGFRRVFASANRDTKRTVVKNFLKIIQEADEDFVLTYEGKFFRASDLHYIEPEERIVIKSHLLGRLEKQLSLDILTAISGLGSELVPDDTAKFANPLIRGVLYSSDRISTEARRLLQEEYSIMNNEVSQKLSELLHDWIRFLEHKNEPALAQKMKQLKDDVELYYIPELDE